MCTRMGKPIASPHSEPGTFEFRRLTSSLLKASLPENLNDMIRCLSECTINQATGIVLVADFIVHVLWKCGVNKNNVSVLPGRPYWRGGGLDIQDGLQ